MITLKAIYMEINEIRVLTHRYDIVLRSILVYDDDIKDKKRYKQPPHMTIQRSKQILCAAITR